ALVRHPVVSVAQQDHVREISLPTVGPVDDVVGIGPACRPMAARPLAMTIAGVERPTHCTGDHTTRASDVDHDGLGGQHYAGDGFVARVALHGRRRHRNSIYMSA